MTFKLVYAVAAFAAIGSGAVRAEADASQYIVQFEGSRLRAEVQREASSVAATRSTEPAGSRIAGPLKSAADVNAVRAEAAQALRMGQISQGEVGAI